MMPSHLPSSFLPSFAEGIERFTERHFWLVVTIGFLFTIELNGVGLVPGEGYQKYAQHPFVTRVDISPTNEWQESILLPLIAFWLGATTRVTFNALCVAILLLGYSSFLVGSVRRNGQAVTILLFTLLLGHPVTAIIWSWIGLPDCLSFLYVVLSLFVRSRLAFFSLASLSMMNHPAGAIAVGSIVVLRLVAHEKTITLHHCGLVLAGGLVGGVLVRAFMAYHEIFVRSRLDYLLAMSLGEWVQLNLSTLPSTLFSFQQTLWFVMVFLFFMFARKDPMYFRVLGVIMIAAYGITFFTLDSTRVFVMLTWGATIHAISHCISLNKTEYGELDAKTVLGVIGVFAIAGLLIPRFYIWNGGIHHTPFNTTLEMIRQIH